MDDLQNFECADCKIDQCMVCYKYMRCVECEKWLECKDKESTVDNEKCFICDRVGCKKDLPR